MARCQFSESQRALLRAAGPQPGSVPRLLSPRLGVAAHSAALPAWAFCDSPRSSFAPKDFVSSSALFVALQTGLSTASDSSGSCISSPAIAVHNPARSQHPVSVRPGKPSLTSLMHPFQWCNGESRDWRVSGHRSEPGPEPSFAVPERSWRPAVLCTARSLKRPILSIWE